MVEINSMPLVSVILPVYLGEDYIKETIRCILSQTYTKIELLVIDDGSPDKSGAIADQAASLDARLTVFHQPHRGVSAAARRSYRPEAGGHRLLRHKAAGLRRLLPAGEGIRLHLSGWTSHGGHPQLRLQVRHAHHVPQRSYGAGPGGSQ